MFNYYKIKTLITELQNEKKSIRIQDIADGIGIAKGSFENYRDGTSKPTVEVLEKIAVYFKKDMNYFFDQPEWKNYDMKIKPHEQLNEPVAEYQQTSSSRNPWELLYETQRELMEVKVENERLKNGYAPAQDANVG